MCFISFDSSRLQNPVFCMLTFLYPIFVHTLSFYYRGLPDVMDACEWFICSLHIEDAMFSIIYL